MRYHGSEVGNMSQSVGHGHKLWSLAELANTIDSGIDIGYFGGIDIDIGIDKRPLQLLVLILVLIRGLPELLAILFIKENTVITASRQRQPTFPSVFLLFLPA